MSKENKENTVWCGPCTSRIGTRKKWDLNPDLPVILPPWSECDNNDFSNAESVPPTPTKASVTFTIYKGDNTSTAEEDNVSLQNKTRCKRGVGGPVNITNNINSTKQNEKKDARRSWQVVSKVTVEKKKRVQQRRSMDVRKVTTKSTLPGLPQRKLTLKKPTVTSVQHRGVKCILYLCICLFIYLFYVFIIICRTIALCL